MNADIGTNHADNLRDAGAAFFAGKEGEEQMTPYIIAICALALLLVRTMKKPQQKKEE